MGNIVNTVKRFLGYSADATSFQRCSYLSNITPRLDKCTFGDNDSSVMGKTASAINDSINGCEALYKDVDNKEMHLTTGSTSRSGCLGDIDCFTLSIARTEPPGGYGAKQERETQNETILTDAKEHGGVNHSNSTGLICNRTADRGTTADHVSHGLEDESDKNSINLTAVISEDFFSTVPEENCCTNPVVAEDLENNPPMDTHKGKELRLHRVSPANSLCNCDAYEKMTDGVNLGCKSIPEASVNDEMVPNEDITACAPFDVRGCESTPKASLKRRANQKRTNRKASNQMVVPNENIGTLIPSDVKYREMEKLPTSPLVKQSSTDKVLQHTPRSLMIRTPLSYVRSPLTRSKAKALSVSTPESLKLRSTRSGRLIVPRLDPGSQNIFYDTDGSILGITNLELQRPQGSNSEPPAKRRKRSRCSSPGHGRLPLF